MGFKFLKLSWRSATASGCKRDGCEFDFCVVFGLFYRLLFAGYSHSGNEVKGTIKWKVEKGIVLMGMKWLNNRILGSLCLPCYVSDISIHFKTYMYEIRVLNVYNITNMILLPKTENKTLSFLIFLSI